MQVHDSMTMLKLKSALYQAEQACRGDDPINGHLDRPLAALLHAARETIVTLESQLSLAMHPDHPESAAACDSTLDGFNQTLFTGASFTLRADCDSPINIFKVL